MGIKVFNNCFYVTFSYFYLCKNLHKYLLVYAKVYNFAIQMV